MFPGKLSDNENFSVTFLEEKSFVERTTLVVVFIVIAIVILVAIGGCGLSWKKIKFEALEVQEEVRQSSRNSNETNHLKTEPKRNEVNKIKPQARHVKTEGNINSKKKRGTASDASVSNA